MTVRILIADDHPVVRHGIAGLLSEIDGFEVVATASDGLEAVSLAAALSPDLILMDLRMPRLDGIEATARILAEQPDIRVLVLTTYETDNHILGAIEAGANGYLLKAAPQDEIVAGIRAVINGETVLSPSIATMLVRHVKSEPVEAAAIVLDLSPREREVLRLVGQGNSNAQIAARLYIAESTVKTHLLHAFEKLGVSDRTRAVTLAMERGLL